MMIVFCLYIIRVLFMHCNTYLNEIDLFRIYPMLFGLLLLCQMIYEGCTLYTTPPIWITSNYVRAGNQNVISVLTNQATTPIPNHNFTFSSPLTGTPHLGYGIKAYEGYDYLGEEMFEVNRTYLDRFQFRVSVQIIGVTNILRLNVPYIAIDPTFPHHLNSFDNVPVNYSAGPISNISVSSSSVQTYTNVINYTTQAAGRTHNTFLPPYSRNKVLLFMTSLIFMGTIEKNDPPPYRPINFHVSTQVISVDQYKIVVSLGQLVNISKLHFSMVIFDQADVESTGQYMLVYSIVQLPYTGGFIPVPIEFVNNFILGLIYFSANKTCTIVDFQWDFANVSGVHGASMPLSVGQTNKVFGTQPINKVAYTLFYLKTWYCPNQTYFDPAQNLCTGCPIFNCTNCYNLTVCSICDEANDFFLNSSSGQCTACSLEGCLNCSNLTTCETCNASDGYSLVNQTCLKCSSVANSFLNSTNQQCQLCSISNCLVCSSLTQCQACDSNNSYYLPSPTSSCTYCNSSANLFISNSSCIGCQMVGCDICSSLTTCQTCSASTGHYLNGTHCEYDCSIISNCSIPDNTNNTNNDTNNTNNTVDNSTADINSTNNTVDNNTFNSTNSTINSTDNTNSTTPIPSTLQLYTKSGCNQFTYQFQLPPSLLPTCLQDAYFTTPGLAVTTTSLKATQAAIQVSYSRDIYKQQLSLLIPCSSHLYSLVLTYQPMVPSLYYTPSECAASDSISDLLTAVQIISYILLLMSLLSCKIVGLELFGVLQLAYFSLASYDHYNIYLHPLTQFKTFNGLNIPFQAQSSSLPPTLTQMKVAANFLNNCNIMLVVFFAQLILSIALYFTSKIIQSLRMKKLSLRLLKQGFITLILFNVFNIAFSAGVNWKYSNPQDSNHIFNLLAIVATFLSMAVASAAIQLTNEEQYGEFQNKFKNNCVCKVYILLSILYRFAIGLYIALHNEYPESTLLVLAISLSFIMYNIINLPFADTLQNYRCNLVHITQLVTLFVANYYREMKMNTPMNVKAKIYAPAILELILIVMCIAVSALVLVYQIVIQVRHWAKERRKVSHFSTQNQIQNQSNETIANL